MTLKRPSRWALVLGFSLALASLCGAGALAQAPAPGASPPAGDAKPGTPATNAATPPANGNPASPPAAAPSPPAKVMKADDPIPACAVAVGADVEPIKDDKGAIVVPGVKKSDGTYTNCSPNSGDTAWMLTSMALVLMMTIPGLGLFYGGMVRKKNVGDTVMTSFAITALVTVIFACVTYTLAFTNGNGATAPFIGGLSRLFMQGVVSDIAHGVGNPNPLAATIPEVVYMCFQMTFAIITPALIAGAFAERMKFSAMLWFIGLWAIFVYAPVAHMVWNGDGLLNSANSSAFVKVLDYAGGTVVHINAGIAGLVCAIMLGKRTETGPGHNMVLTFIGAGLLWVGWFGFNAGSAVTANLQAGMAMTVTQIATAVAALAWMLIEWAHRGKPTCIGLASGAVAGLVAITPASGFVGPIGALVIGAAAGAACYIGATGLKHMLGYDDALDCFGVHGVGGIVGALLTGVFAVEQYGGTKGLLEGNPQQFINQCIGVGIVIVYDLVVSVIILTIIKVTIGLRVSPEVERDGLDLALHAEIVH